MPFYDYYCPANGATIEVRHKMNETFKTWAEVCRLANISVADTSEDSPVQRVLSIPQITTPPSYSKLKELGFTKLVKRGKGVYENVTAASNETKIVKADDLSTMPNLSGKIKD